MGNRSTARGALVGAAIFAASNGCSSGDDGHNKISLPLVTPPVRAATPVGLGGAPALKASSLRRALQALDSSDLKQRFFTAGPTNLFQILDSIDDRIRDLNNADTSTCLAQEPVAYSVTPYGENLTFYAQCYQTFTDKMTGETAFIQVGQRDGVTYLYVSTGVQHTAARLIPVAGTSLFGIDGGTSESGDAGAALGQYRVDAWIGVGYSNATQCSDHSGFDDCSYGAIVLHSDENRAAFELSVAGVGFGYCGAQLVSDGNRVFVTGSLDMGSTCLATDSACVQASDISTPTNCTGLNANAAHALGRRATSSATRMQGESAYPGGSGNFIVLNGTSTDSLHFGPSAPTAGATDLGNGK